MKVLLNTRRTELFIITGRGCSAGMHFIAVHPAGQFMKAGGIEPSHSKRKTTCPIVLQSLCSGAPRSAWVATVHIFGIFFFSFFLFFLFFFIFSLFFVRAAGAGSGTLKVKTLKGMLSYVRSFAAWNACR
ncbi:hypothetical protein B6J05_27525 [Klebsiella quasipneumoniae]|nr:hypothetical protein HMPREF3096_04065 [Klebsiella sp. HMSC25G12]PLF13927.1 hypothetical protein B6I87_07690 [Klebsiella quasipneumoniae]PLG14690.1 hypothetical protein B6J05_27525 [Klebsiella quasipneumoniae]